MGQAHSWASENGVWQDRHYVGWREMRPGAALLVLWEKLEKQISEDPWKVSVRLCPQQKTPGP